MPTTILYPYSLNYYKMAVQQNQNEFFKFTKIRKLGNIKTATLGNNINNNKSLIPHIKFTNSVYKLKYVDCSFN